MQNLLRVAYGVFLAEIKDSRLLTVLRAGAEAAGGDTSRALAHTTGGREQKRRPPSASGGDAHEQGWGDAHEQGWGDSVPSPWRGRSESPREARRSSPQAAPAPLHPAG